MDQLLRTCVTRTPCFPHRCALDLGLQAASHGRGGLVPSSMLDLRRCAIYRGRSRTGYVAGSVSRRLCSTMLTIPADQVNRFLFATKAIYHAPNPYHNYVHAIDVLQATYTFLMNLGVVPPFSYLRDANRMRPWARPDEEDAPVGGLGTRRAREVMRPQDVLAIVVSAMGHDVGHPGLSNAFMVSFYTMLCYKADARRKMPRLPCLKSTTTSRSSRTCTACS